MIRLIFSGLDNQVLISQSFKSEEVAKDYYKKYMPKTYYIVEATDKEAIQEAVKKVQSLLKVKESSISMGSLSLIEA